MIKTSKTDVELIEAISILLLSWNINWYKRQKKRFDGKHFNAILNAYQKNKILLRNLSKENIFEANIYNNKENIIGLFDHFNRIVGPTGTSKVLHLLCPELFVMWDSRIRNGNDGNAYYKFLQRMQLEAREAVESFSKAHKCSKKEAYAKLSKERTIAKLLDEANYVTAWKK